jgi:hypothetical protein
LAQTPDPILLEWAASQDRVIITRDVNTLIGFACGRVQAGQPMAGVLVLRRTIGVGQAINEILLVAQCYTADEIKDQIIYLTL